MYPRALVVINPGNPTGTQLAATQLAGLLSLCHKERLTVLADEVRDEGKETGRSAVVLRGTRSCAVYTRSAV